MKLYEFAAAPNPKRVSIFIREKGITIPIEQVDVSKGAQFSDEYKAINPLSTVPALQLDDGTVLSEVPAIVEYLECMHPENPLLGRNPVERALVREWSHRTFMGGFLGVAEAFRNSTPGFVDRALPGPDNYEQIPALAERGRLRVPRFMQVLDQQLCGREFIIGDYFSFADIDAFVFCSFAAWIKQPILEECEDLQRWFDAVSARPSVQ